MVSGIIESVFYQNMPCGTKSLISKLHLINYHLSAILISSYIVVILFIGKIMKFVVSIISLFSILLVSENKINPVMQVETDSLGFKQLSVPLNKIITIIKI